MISILKVNRVEITNCRATVILTGKSDPFFEIKMLSRFEAENPTFPKVNFSVHFNY